MVTKNKSNFYRSQDVGGASRFEVCYKVACICEMVTRTKSYFCQMVTCMQPHLLDMQCQKHKKTIWVDDSTQKEKTRKKERTEASLFSEHERGAVGSSHFPF